MRFVERTHTKPDLVPSQEHYRSVFDNYRRYKELGGNGYVDVLIEQIENLYKEHYKQESWPPRRIK
jgi:hypothetical protein